MTDIAASISKYAGQYADKALNAAGVQGASSDTKAMETESAKAFSSVLDSAVQMLEETNILSNNADTAQMNFAMGYSENTHDLAIAMRKAQLSLQYTVAVKNQLISAYKEIMNIQI